MSGASLECLFFSRTRVCRRVGTRDCESGMPSEGAPPAHGHVQTISLSSRTTSVSFERGLLCTLPVTVRSLPFSKMRWPPSETRLTYRKPSRNFLLTRYRHRRGTPCSTKSDLRPPEWHRIKRTTNTHTLVGRYVSLSYPATTLVSIHLSTHPHSGFVSPAPPTNQPTTTMTTKKGRRLS